MALDALPTQAHIKQIHQIAGILLSLVTPPVNFQSLRCEMDENSTEWIQIFPGGDWREWEGSVWGPPLCDRQLQNARQVERWHCQFGRWRHVLTYTLTDRHSSGVYRRVETLEIHSGQYHRLIVDGTHVSDGGKQLVLEFRGRCEVWQGALPIDDEK